MYRNAGRRITAWILCLCAVLVFMPGGAQAAPQAAPLSQNGMSLNDTVRVYLSSISGSTSLSLTVDGAYTINGSQALPGGSAKVSYESGQLYLTVNGSKQAMGQQLFLRRSSGSGIKIAQAPSPANWYNGDLEFAVRNGRMYPIVHVYIEQYLYGVLPYEMSSSFPLEALKAQAVAARTYTAQAMAKHAAYYDVVDTTTDQVYRGIGSGIERCKQAVNETAGVIAMYNGSYVGGYYTASNGGQTEAVKNIWGGTSYPYLGVQDDPYDLANPSSMVKTFTVRGNGMGNGALDTLLKSKAAAKLNTSPAQVTVTGIQDIAAHSPLYPAPSRLYAKVDVSLSALVNGSSTNMTVTLDFFNEMKSALGLRMNSTKSELLTVEQNGSDFMLIARRYGHGVGMSQRGAQEMANQGLTYRQILGFYYPGCELIAHNFSNNGSGGIDPVPDPGSTPEPQTPVDDARSQARVSLSNPASWLNLRGEPSTGGAILAQLLHGQTVKVLSTNGTWCKVQYGALSGYVMQSYLVFAVDDPAAPGDPADPVNPPAPTPAPGGDIVPTPGPQAGAQYMVAVTLQDIGSKLNMRSAPNTYSSIIVRLAHGTLLEVYAEEGPWLRVRYGLSEGYVMGSYVTRTQDVPPMSTPTPGPGVPQPEAPGEGGLALVTVTTGTTLNMRLDPSTLSAILTRIPNGAAVQWKPYDGEWVWVSYGNLQGYAIRVFLAFAGGGDGTPAPTDPNAAPGPDATPAPQSQTAIVSLNDYNSRLNMRASASTSAQIIGSVPNGAQVRILQYDTSWCEAQYSDLYGYLSTNYLLFAQLPENTPTATEPTAAATPTPDPSATQNPPASGGGELIVTADILNMRAAASTSAGRLAELPYGTRLTELETLPGWYKVRWNDVEGYVSAAYVYRADQGIPPAPTEPAQTAPPIESAQPTQKPNENMPTPAPEATQEPTQAPTTVPALEPTPAPTPEVPQMPPPYWGADGGINEGIVAPLPGEQAIQAYSEPDLDKPCWKILGEERLVVVAYAGEESEWCEVQFGESTCYVLTERLKLTNPMPID